jgi:hypothetical protein
MDFSGSVLGSLETDLEFSKDTSFEVKQQVRSKMDTMGV